MKNSSVLLKTVVIVAVIFVCSLLGRIVVSVVNAANSNQPDSNVGACYEENWQAENFYILRKSGNSYRYHKTNNPETASAENMQDFVITEWTVTGSVSYAEK